MRGKIKLGLILLVAVLVELGAWIILEKWSLSDKIAVIASVVAFLQFTALIATVLVMKSSAEKQLRAYVFVTETQIIAAKDGTIIMHEDGRPLQIGYGNGAVSQIVYSNTGQTPAYDVTINGDIKFLDWPIDESKLVIKELKEKSVESIGAGSKRNKFDILKQNIAGENINNLILTDIQNLKSGKVAICVYGVINYKDAFGRKQTTEYRYFVGGPVGIRGIALSAHEKGNKAT